LDGADADYVDRSDYDSTGRFIPLWYRKADGEIEIDIVRNYDRPGAGDGESSRAQPDPCTMYSERL